MQNCSDLTFHFTDLLRNFDEQHALQSLGARNGIFSNEMITYFMDEKDIRRQLNAISRTDSLQLLAESKAMKSAGFP